MTDTKESEDWAFYRSRINDAPASVTTNLALLSRAPIAGYDHLGWVFLPMADPGPHGMGTAETAATLNAVEDRLVAQVLEHADVIYVGRVRGEGKWQLYFYARDPDALETVARDALREWPSQRFTIDYRRDPDWSAFRSFIAPTAERIQWIQDFRVVEQLGKLGDPLTEHRPVDHWIYFVSADARDAFLDGAARLGFKAAALDDNGAQVTRVDSVALADIHQVVMELVELAAMRGGRYDGWESIVLAAKSP